jgi:transcriptional regulator with XRE-family HTH domain
MNKRTELAMQLLEEVRVYEKYPTWKEMERQIGITEGYISKLRTNYRTIGPEVLRRMARAYPQFADSLNQLLLLNDAELEYMTKADLL